jgi:hypothetical protein
MHVHACAGPQVRPPGLEACFASFLPPAPTHAISPSANSIRTSCIFLQLAPSQSETTIWCLGILPLQLIDYHAREIRPLSDDPGIPALAASGGKLSLFGIIPHRSCSMHVIASRTEDI